MSQGQDAAKQHTLPPPSYEEAVLGYTSGVKEHSNPPFSEAPSHTPSTTQSVPFYPQQLPATQYNVQPYNAQTYSQQNQTPMRYNMCPPGAEPLVNLSEILVYPARGRIYKIKDPDKITIMTAKVGWVNDCCGCCDTDNYPIYTLRSVDGQVQSARANLIMDAWNCCSYSPRHLEVEAPLGVPLGIIRIQSDTICKVENLSGDLLYELHRQKGCCDVTPYQIFTTDGRVVGQIDHTRGVKHRLTLPKEMPINQKILLLFFMITMQAESDSRRDS